MAFLPASNSSSARVTRGMAHRAAQLRIGLEATQRGDQPVAVAGLDRQAGRAVDDEVGEPADVRDDDGQPGRRRLDGGDAERLGTAREHEDVARVEQLAEAGSLGVSPCTDSTRGCRSISERVTARSSLSSSAAIAASSRSPPLRAKSPPTNSMRIGPSPVCSATPHVSVSTPGGTTSIRAGAMS